MFLLLQLFKVQHFGLYLLLLKVHDKLSWLHIKKKKKKQEQENVISSWAYDSEEVKYRVQPSDSTAITFCDSFSSSSLTVSICDRDLRHSLLKMSFISGEHSDRTFRHNEMRSTSSSVIGFLGREDLPRWSTVTIISMASATNDWRFTERGRD